MADVSQATSVWVGPHALGAALVRRALGGAPDGQRLTREPLATEEAVATALRLLARVRLPAARAAVCRRSRFRLGTHVFEFVRILCADDAAS